MSYDFNAKMPMIVKYENLMAYISDLLFPDENSTTITVENNSNEERNQVDAEIDANSDVIDTGVGTQGRGNVIPGNSNRSKSAWTPEQQTVKKPRKRGKILIKY